ncbi:MAG TPA: DUF5000 domain-containing lipoprotein [Pelobium sp.]|nr:DUF5000 domain-containing lipoprotein [Pelobium sp.]
MNTYFQSNIIPVLFILLVSFTACQKMDSYNDPVSSDMTKPDVITNVKITNFNGGAYITYDLPQTENLLYVLAQYKINGKTTRETKSSFYSDTITVEGFAKSADYEVTLYAVSRANVKSDPVIVKVHPDTPPYLLIKPTIDFTADFGGINVTGKNPLKNPVGVIIIALDSSLNSLEVQDQYYTKLDTINYSVRGYNATPHKFGVYVTDQYGNVSDTIIKTVTPLYETLLDKSKFFAYKLPSDTEIGYGWDLPYFWDNKTDGSSNGWHTNPGATAPFIATFGIGKIAKLSRFILWERPNEYAYGHGNPEDFTIWGSSKDSPQDAIMPLNSAIGTVVGDWVNLGNYHFPDPPSGLLPGSTNAQDEAFVRAGVNFNFAISNPKVKFIRFAVRQSWSHGDFAHAMEISLYGDPN